MMNMPVEFRMLCGGQLIDTPEHFSVINPATETAVAKAPACSRELLDTAVIAAQQAFSGWKALGWEARSQALLRCSEQLMAKVDTLKLLLTAEQGKPVAAAQFEIETAAWWLSEVAKSPSTEQHIDDFMGQQINVQRVPLGVVGSIAPWNFPVLMAIWKMGPALLTGNTVVLKPSPYTPLTTLYLGELFQPLFPDGVLNIISGGNELGQWMTEHPGIAKISFTGSTATGKKVMSSASRTLKRLTLELGGNDAAIVLADANVDEIAEKLFWAAFSNSGQVCVAAKRIYIHDSIYDQLAARLAEIASLVRVGDGAVDETQMGPVQNRQQYDIVCSILEDCRDSGHRFLSGGQPVDCPGYFISPTLVDNPPEDSLVVQKEAFGPVVPLLRYADIDEVVQCANALNVGLAASVWGTDIQAAQAVAEQLDTGTVWINSAQGILPCAPFAGHKQSGFGVEHGDAGLLEYTLPKAVYTPN